MVVLMWPGDLMLKIKMPALFYRRKGEGHFSEMPTVADKWEGEVKNRKFADVLNGWSLLLVICIQASKISSSTYYEFRLLILQVSV